MEVEAKLICHQFWQSCLTKNYYLIFQGCETCFTLVSSKNAAGFIDEKEVSFQSMSQYDFLPAFIVFLFWFLFLLLFLHSDNAHIKVERSTSDAGEKKQKKAAAQVHLLLFNQCRWEDASPWRHHLYVGSQNIDVWIALTFPTVFSPIADTNE